MFTKVFKIILSYAVLVTLVMFSKDICRFSLKNMSMSLIKIYRTPTTTNERLPTEQQNGYHGFATEQFIEGAVCKWYYIALQLSNVYHLIYVGHVSIINRVLNSEGGWMGGIWFFITVKFHPHIRITVVKSHFTVKFDQNIYCIVYKQQFSQFMPSYNLYQSIFHGLNNAMYIGLYVTVNQTLSCMLCAMCW